MTKAKMIEMIQKEEARLWLELAKYDNEMAPVTGSHDEHIQWDKTDPTHRDKLGAWYAVRMLMESMDIIAEPEDSPEHSEATDLSMDLFTRRQAAMGIYYDERGNEIA